MKRFISFIIAVSLAVSAITVSANSTLDFETAASNAENAVIDYNRSVELEVKGNRIVEKGTDNTVILRGVNIPSMGWGMEEHIFESMTEVYDNWQANLIRFPIQPKYWFNGSDYMTAEEYQSYVDCMVKAAQARGKYIILDCHTYVMPLAESLDMWKEVAAEYANNNAVLFGLLNEPHDIKPTGDDAERTAWDVWRNGGQITISDEEVTGVGHQELLEEIRALGANNICIAGGLNWAFDISGLADGYDGLENGYRLTDTAEGNGVMYDSHAYPVKGAKSAWDNTIGPVRKVAPILIGEWGWDSSDKAISGGDCTSDIWMNQIMNWMDDTYCEYDGIPVNWTGWNLHMSSSPRMIDSWDFKTTAYNGTYIKNRLLSYGNEPQKFDGVYTNDFEPDVFRGYTPQTGKSSVTYSEENGNIVVYHQPTTWSAKLNFPYDWDLNGLQSITMDVSCDISETVNIGLYGSDMEAWTTSVEVGTDIKTITISIDELVREGNAVTDGKLTGALSGIYIGSTATEKGNITIDNIKLIKLANPIFVANEYEHIDEGAEISIDVDTTDFASLKTVAGPADTSYFKAENVTIQDADGNDTVSKYITYNRTDGPWGGSAQFNLETVPTMNTKYFTVCLKGSGVAQKVGVSLGDVTAFDVALAEGDTDWHQYIFNIENTVEYPEDIKYVKFTSGTKTESYFYADNFAFSIEKPQMLIPNPEKTFIYDFATYNKNTTKYEAKILTSQGSEGDVITAVKADGGLDYETQALEIEYNRAGITPSKALVVYSSSDFFKGNANDDERTANRSTLKSDMSYMTDFVFYGKSSSDKDEQISVGVIDAANSMSTYTTEKTYTLTDEWQQFRVAFEEFNVLDGGRPLECSRVRGFLFSSAEESGAGSFLIDNITHTNAAEIDWEVPTSTPTPDPNETTPTPTAAPTATPDTSLTTPEPVAEPDESTQFVIVTTADELRAVTSADTYIRLGADIDLGTTGIKTKCPTYLDLNGYTLTGNCSAVIEAVHSFVLTDSSEDKGMLINTNTSTSYALKCAAKNTDVKIKDAVVKAAAQAVLLNGENSYLEVNNSAISGGTHAINAAKGNIVIEDSIFNSDTEYKGYALYLNGTNVVINSGIFNYNGTVSTIAVATTSNLTINGGEFYNINKDKGTINNVKGFTGTITINGGTFENTYDGNGYSILDSDEDTTDIKPTINITGGTFKSAIKSVKTTSTTNITVTGGTFYFDPTVYVDLTKSTVEDNGEGIYTVYSADIPTDEPTETPTEEVSEYEYSAEIVKFDEESIEIEVVFPKNINDESIMYIAFYDEKDAVLRVYKEENIQQLNTYTTVSGAVKARVFIWDNIMKPLMIKI